MSEPLIFVSYASPDQDRVRKFCDALKAAGYPIWVDYERLKPGQNWDFEISSALARADFIMVFVSNNSVDRRGYVQRELRVALDRLKERLIDDIFIVPVLLDDGVPVPAQLRTVQYIPASRPDCLDQIKTALDHQIQRLGLQRREALAGQDLQWSVETYRESWDGSPGYKFRTDFIDLKSDRFKNVDQIGYYIRGRLCDGMFFWRSTTMTQQTGEWWSRLSSTYDATAGRPSLVGSVISIPYTFIWYGSGAAHPNQDFNVFNFSLEPLATMPELALLFGHQEEALAVIQTAVRAQLLSRRDEDGTQLLDQAWVESGTSKWENLAIHEYLKDGLRFLFAPYHVAAYALGSFSVEVPYSAIARYMQPAYRKLLGIDDRGARASS